MADTLYRIEKKDLLDLFGRISKSYRVIVPYKKKEAFFLDEFDPAREGDIELGGIRQSQPIKSFLNPAREDIRKEPLSGSRPLLLAGIKACDLASLPIQDFVFQEGDVKDPFYADNRKNTFIIACDCTYAVQTCFCLAMEGRPYPKKYFDLSLSAIEDYFLVETGSEKGSGLIDDFRVFFKEAAHSLKALRDENRAAVSGQVKGFIDKTQTPDTSRIKGKVREGYNLTAIWQDSSSTCVECGACNLVCPTCHCFLIFDEKNHNGGNGRFRVWDSCLYKTFARVAGGANPRKHLYERLRNRFEKKFDFFPKVLNYFACTGCGRCIEACPGDIDIREVLKGLVNGKWDKPPHK